MLDNDDNLVLLALAVVFAIIFMFLSFIFSQLISNKFSLRNMK